MTDEIKRPEGLALRTSEAAIASRGKLSEAQRRVLRWLDENPQTKSEWVDGYTVLEVSGPNGSIRIPEADTKALAPLVSYGRRDRIHDLNDAGRAALQAERGEGNGSRSPDLKEER